eukprot:4465225-Pleurochrysis_carterae.AAC.1
MTRGAINNVAVGLADGYAAILIAPEKGNLIEDVVKQHISNFCHLKVERCSIGISIRNGALAAVNPRYIRVERRGRRHR